MFKESSRNKVKLFDLKSIVYYLLIILLITTSFFLFSSAFYPLVNSDMAINVLIADTFSLPHDIYCWNQDRGGMLIPLIAHLIVKILSIKPIIAVSIANYLMLILGFIGFSKLFKHKTVVLLFALVWFFPYQRFIDLTSFPLGVSYSLLGFSILFIQKIDFKKHLVKDLKNFLLILIIAFIWLCAVWVSDLIFITLLTFGICGALYLVLNKNYPIKILGAIYLVTMIFIVVIIKKLKSYATGVTQSFSSINTLTDIKNAINIVFTKCYEVLFFQDKLFVSLGAWVVFIAVVLGIILFVKNFKKIITFKDFWVNFFIADFVGIILVIFLSHWVLLNQMGRWYFVAPYISFSIFLFILIDRSQLLKKQWFVICFSIGLIITSISQVATIYFTYDEYRSTASYAHELDKLGEIGVIGDFWDSYKLSIDNPQQVKSTPHQDSDVKNPLRIIETLSQPRLFLSRDMWMESFPDSLTQFGQILVKKGEPFFLAGSNLCEYEIKSIPNHLILNPSNLIIQGGIPNDDGSVKFADQQSRTGHSVYGPNVNVLKGEYLIEYYIDLDDRTQLDLIHIDISSNFGQIINFDKSLKQLKYNDSKGCYYFIFNTNESLLNTEFRILEKEPISYIFHKIEINKKV